MGYLNKELKSISPKIKNTFGHKVSYTIKELKDKAAESGYEFTKLSTTYNNASVFAVFKVTSASRVFVGNFLRFELAQKFFG
jgi:hypothetical protein